MAQLNSILLGRIIKVHGFSGAVMIRLEKNFSENLPAMKSVFLEIEGRPVPFFVDYIEHVRSDRAYLKFQDYDSIEMVKEFCGCNVLITQDYSQDEINADDQDLDGFLIVSDENSVLGTVSEIIKNPSQWLLRVNSEDDRAILIPFHDDLIIEIDNEKRIIRMKIPEGLADIN